MAKPLAGPVLCRDPQQQPSSGHGLCHNVQRKYQGGADVEGARMRHRQEESGLRRQEAGRFGVRVRMGLGFEHDESQASMKALVRDHESAPLMAVTYYPLIGRSRRGFRNCVSSA